MIAAVAAWKLRKIRRDGEFFGHLHDFVQQAYDADADLLVLPELFCLELLHLQPDLAERKVPRYLEQYADAIEEWLLRVSESSGITIVGGSHFRKQGERIVNAVPIAEPGRPLTIGTKNNLTMYEREVWDLAPGAGLARPANPWLGVTICYDSEFPEAGRALVDAGILVHAVPAYTETQHGFQRVRWCCQARATENQYFVLHSSLIGDLGREPVPETYGSSAILTPSIAPFPINAILAETPINEEGLAIADLILPDIEVARNQGDVRNYHDRHSGDWTFA